jgi:hypothetical protein
MEERQVRQQGPGAALSTNTDVAIEGENSDMIQLKEAEEVGLSEQTEILGTNPSTHSMIGEQVEDGQLSQLRESIEINSSSAAMTSPAAQEPTAPQPVDQIHETRAAIPSTNSALSLELSHTSMEQHNYVELANEFKIQSKPPNDRSQATVTKLSGRKYIKNKYRAQSQLIRITTAGSSRWLLTVALCGGYMWIVRAWAAKGTEAEGNKRVFNLVTTAINIGLGLNLASAFKDMALNLRWPVLASTASTLTEVSLGLFFFVPRSS